MFLLSNLSHVDLQTRFLPSFFGEEGQTGSLAAKVLTSYVHVDGITPPGRHAADQLLLRLKYLNFEGTVAELVRVFVYAADTHETYVDTFSWFRQVPMGTFPPRTISNL